MPMPVLCTLTVPSPVTRNRRPAAGSSIGRPVPSSATLLNIEPTHRLPAGSARPSLRRALGQFVSASAKSARASVRGCHRTMRPPTATAKVSLRSVSASVVGGSSKNQLQVARLAGS
jgi:hypothetical protein